MTGLDTQFFYFTPRHKSTCRKGEKCRQQPNTAQTPAALPLSPRSSPRWNWSTVPQCRPSKPRIICCAALRPSGAGPALKPSPMACAPCASMAACAGLWLVSKPHWGWRNDGRRYQSPADAPVVRYAVPLVSQRGPPMTTPKGKAPAPTKTQGAHGEQLSFLPPPPFCPTWPKRGTLADKALGMLMNGRLIDHPEFEDATQSWRLGAVIFTLRALGWPVETIEVPSPTEHSPDRIIALYRLDGKYTAQALAMNGGAA